MQAFQDIFISYGRKDSLTFASLLNRRLVDLGFTVWFDYDDIPLGVDYQKEIDDGIERADNFIFVISPHAINSPYCSLELELALKYKKRIIPWLHVERIGYETWQERNPQGTPEEWEAYQAKGLHDHFQNMHPVLRKINWIYGRQDQDDFESAFGGLLEICDRDKDYVHQHTRILAQTLEWERNQKRSSFLLIGEERLKAEDWIKFRFSDSQPPCLPTPLQCEFITESRKNAENLMTEVFIAYADENRSLVEQIAQGLQREGFTLWTNLTDIQAGAEFQTVIDRGIEETDNVVYLLSPASGRSPYCQHELEYALSLQKRIIPLLVEPTPTEEIPLALRDLQYIDLTDQVEQLVSELDISPLLKILCRDAAYHKTHKLLLNNALKWDRQNRNPTLLMRGYNLKQAETWLKVAQTPPLPLQTTFIQESLRQPPGLSLDVFISYSRANSGFARRLNDALQLQGKRTWFDQENIAAGTADFQQEIHRGIETADIFLFILSPRSITSPYCADEVEYAANFNKRFVTILHQPIDTADLHPELAKVQWLDFNRNKGDFSTNFMELLRILDTDSDHLHAHTRLLIRAIEWDEKGRKESLLLRADELSSAEQWLSQCEGKEPKPTELQQSYLSNSRSVEDAKHQAEQILQAAAAKGALLVRLGAIAGSIGLVVAGGAGWFAVRAANQIKEANIHLKLAAVREDLLEGQQLQALLKALDASKTLRTEFRENSAVRKTIQPFVMGALQQATYKIREKNSLSGHEEGISDIRFSPDGKTIASGSGDKTIKLWDAKTGELIDTLEGHQDLVNTISFSPDGKTIASGSGDKTIKLWDAKTGELIDTLEGHQDLVNTISFSPDGKTIASGSGDNTIKLWDVQTRNLIDTLEGHQDWVNAISFSPDGQTIASGSGDNTIRLWDTATGTLIPSLEGHQGGVNDIYFSPNGKTIASGSIDGTIKLWDVKTGKLSHSLEGHQDWIETINFSPDGKTIASGGDDKTIKLWDVKTRELIDSLEGHQEKVNAIHFSPDGKTIASGSGDNTIKLWDAKTGELIDTLEGHQEWVLTIRFSPNGKTIASGGYDKTIKLWDAKTRELIDSLEGHQKWVNDIRFSPDGKTIASGSGDNTIKLWDAKTGELIHSLKEHQQVITEINFSPDGKTIASASGSGDGTIKLWDTETGKLIQSLKGDQDAVWAINFSPDGKTIASGSGDGDIKLWVWDYDRLTKIGCDWIQQYLMSRSTERDLCENSAFHGKPLWGRSSQFGFNATSIAPAAFHVISPELGGILTHGIHSSFRLSNLRLHKVTEPHRCH